MEAIKDNFDVKMKGIIVKNIEGNRGKLKTQDIWKYRALRSDYYLFKHEYIFVFKKQENGKKHKTTYNDENKRRNSIRRALCRE